MVRAAAAATDAVVALEAACQGADAWSAWLVREACSGSLPTVRYLVRRGRRRVLGYAVASYAGDIAELQRIGVAPAARRRAGWRTALLQASGRPRRRARGANRLLLEVREDNRAALAFYAARGFVEIDRRPRYYRDGVDAVVMRLPLVKGCG